MMATYLAFAVAVATLIASPGPIMALVISESRYGRPINTIIGAIVSAQILLATTLLIIYFSLDINSTMLDFFQIFGGGYLVWLGINTLRTGIRRKYRVHATRGSEKPNFLIYMGCSYKSLFLHLSQFLPQSISFPNVSCSRHLTGSFKSAFIMNFQRDRYQFSYAEFQQQTGDKWLNQIGTQKN